MLKNASTQCHSTEEFSLQHKTFQNVNSYINYDMEDIAMFQGLHPSLCHCNKFHTASDTGWRWRTRIRTREGDSRRTSYIGILFALLDVVNQTSVTQPSCKGREEKRSVLQSYERAHTCKGMSRPHFTLNFLFCPFASTMSVPRNHRPYTECTRTRTVRIPRLQAFTAVCQVLQSTMDFLSHHLGPPRASHDLSPPLHLERFLLLTLSLNLTYEAPGTWTSGKEV